MKKIFYLSLPLLLALVGGWLLRVENDFFIVRDVRVDLELHENQEALLVSLKPQVTKALLGLKGQNIWTVSLKSLRQELINSSWIKDVELSKKFPNQISALIKLQPVAFLYLDKRNRIFPILENGLKMPQIKASLAPVAPILRNNNILKEAKELSRLLKLFSEVPSIGALKKENIGSVDYNSVTGLTLKLIRGSITVHLGHKNIQTKALQVLRVTDYLQSQKQKARVIDASFTKKVLVRLRKRS